MKKVKVAITGIGSTIGLGIAKAVRMSRIPTHIIGLDSNPLSVGLFSLDSSEVVPYAGNCFDSYYDALVQICQSQKVDILFSGWDGELLELGGRPFQSDSNGTVLGFDPTGIETALDKWLTFQKLSSAGVGTPDTCLASDRSAVISLLNKHSGPYIMKPRKGAGSRGLHKVNTLEEILFFSSYLTDPVLQEMLVPDEEEYTVGVFMLDDSLSAGTLTLKRSLMSGLSYRMEVIENETISKVALDAVRAIGLRGAANVQLRLTSKGPKVFEINPRFSCSSCVRAFFGFNEAEMAIEFFKYRQRPTIHDTKYGVCLRYWEEMYLPTQAQGTLPDRNCKGFSFGIIPDGSKQGVLE